MQKKVYSSDINRWRIWRDILNLSKIWLNWLKMAKCTFYPVMLTFFFSFQWDSRGWLPVTSIRYRLQFTYRAWIHLKLHYTRKHRPNFLIKTKKKTSPMYFQEFFYSIISDHYPQFYLRGKVSFKIVFCIAN